MKLVETISFANRQWYLSNWKTEPNPLYEHEIDIEFSRWGWNQSTHNTQYTFQWRDSKNGSITESQITTAGLNQLLFNETNVGLSANVASADPIIVRYFESQPNEGNLPNEVVILCDYYWQITNSDISFSDGHISSFITSFGEVNDPNAWVWLKRENSRNDWQNIGGEILENKLVNTID